MLYVTANPNGEAEIITVKLTSGSKARKKVFDFDFSQLEIKGRGAGGNILSRYPVRRVELKSEGVSTLSGLNLWYDETIGRLNKEQRGTFLGTFNGDDKILTIQLDGNYIFTDYEITNRYDPKKIISIERFDPSKVVTAVYYDGGSKAHFVKRFQIETLTPNKPFLFISESPGSRLELVSTADRVVAEMELNKGKGRMKELETIELHEFIDVKGWKSIGNKLTNFKLKKIKIIEETSEKSKAVPDPPDIPEAQLMKDVQGQEVQDPKKEKEKEKEKPKDIESNDKTGKTGKKKDDEGFGIGSTIELDF